MSHDQLLQALVGAPPAQAQRILGEVLYALIWQEQGPLAGKITGMLLEGLDSSELVALVDDRGALRGKIREALEALEAHAARARRAAARGGGGAWAGPLALGSGRLGGRSTLAAAGLADARPWQRQARRTLALGSSRLGGRSTLAAAG